jgi:hypothetical protein
MKYHYKSPGELREEQSRESTKLRSKSARGNLIIFADLVVIVLVFGGIYYAGLLRPERYVSSEIATYAPFEFSGSVELPDSDGEAFLFYLNVKNAGPDPRDFPPPHAGATIEIVDPGAPGGVGFSAEFPLTVRTVRPGETTIYRVELAAPVRDVQKGQARVRLYFADGGAAVVVL